MAAPWCFLPSVVMLIAVSSKMLLAVSSLEGFGCVFQHWDSTLSVPAIVSSSHHTLTFCSGPHLVASSANQHSLAWLTTCTRQISGCKLRVYAYVAKRSSCVLPSAEMNFLPPRSKLHEFYVKILFDIFYCGNMSILYFFFLLVCFISISSLRINSSTSSDT